MTTITKERIELFIKNPLENGLTRGEQMELARIALASLEAKPVVYMWDSERKDIDAPGYYRPEHLVFAESSVKQWGGRVVPLYTAPPVPVVPEEISTSRTMLPAMNDQLMMVGYVKGWNACRAAMLHSAEPVSQTYKLNALAGNSPVTPGRLPGGFTIEDAKELHENLVRSHISQALSGEKMKKKDRDADLRWIHGVIVQAAWFVKASLEQIALSGTPPVTTDGWISCSERMPEKNMNVLISVNFDSSLVEPLICSARYTGSTFRRGDATIKPGNGIEQATHWMPLPEPPQEVNQ